MTMELENNVVPDATTEIPAPVVDETPEVVTPESDEPQEVKGEEPDKAIKRMERRIQRLTAAKYESQAELQQARREIEQLRQAQAQVAQDQPPISQEQLAQFIEQRAAQIAQQTRVNETIRQATTRTIESGTKAFGAESFNTATATFVDEVGGLNGPDGKPNPVIQAVLKFDNAHEVIHHLGQDPDTASSLKGLDPIELGIRLAEVRMALKQPKPTPQSNAPRPVTPVRSAARDEGGLSDNLDPMEWAKRFRESRQR